MWGEPWGEWGNAGTALGARWGWAWGRGEGRGCSKVGWQSCPMRMRAEGDGAAFTWSYVQLCRVLGDGRRVGGEVDVMVFGRS